MLADYNNTNSYCSRFALYRSIKHQRMVIGGDEPMSTQLLNLLNIQIAWSKVSEPLVEKICFLWNIAN